MNRTRNRSKNLLIRIGIELFYFSSEAALQSDDECGERRKMEASAAAVAGGQLVVLASSNIARVYRVSTQFPLSLQVLRTHYRD